MTKVKKFRSTRFAQQVLIDGNLVIIRLNVEGEWKDKSDRRYVLKNGRFVPYIPDKPWPVAIPEFVKVEEGGTFTKDGIDYQFQRDESGELVPVRVGRVAPVVSLSMGDSRGRAPAHSMRPK